MGDLYLKFFQEIENGNLWNDYIVLVSHSNSINKEEALFKAQKELVNSDFIITKIDFPYIWCNKFEKLTEKEDIINE